MSLAIKYGLFKLKITDHHAILGVPLDADAKQIHLRYLKIAQKLHPDTCKEDQEKKKLASKLLSKLVNPAYEALSRKTSYAEQQIVLTQIGQHLVKQKNNINLNSKSAQELLTTNSDLELAYHQLLKKLVSKQYQSLEDIGDQIAQISELNLVYLMLKHSQGMNREESSTTRLNKSQPQPEINQQPQPKTEEVTSESRISSYLRRGEEYIEKNNFVMAISEFREALKFDPNHSTCHALLGLAYLRQDQLTMAKIHIGKAYKANPKDPAAIKSKEELDKLTKNQTNGSTSSNRSQTNKSEAQPSNSGFFGGLFGTKKK